MSEAPTFTNDTSSHKKKNRYSLKIQDKCDMLTKLKQGRSVLEIAKEYGVSQSTISDIMQSESTIRSFFTQFGAAALSKSTMKKSVDYNLDAAVYNWYKEKTSQGAVLSNHMICDEALRLNKLLNGRMDFKASKSWLTRFKARHNITNKNRKSRTKSRDDTKSVSSDTATAITLSSAESETFDFTDWMTPPKTETMLPEVIIKEEFIDKDNDNREKREENDQLGSADEEAFNAIETVIQWAKLHGQVNMDEVLFLRKLQSTAAKRALATISRAK